MEKQKATHEFYFSLPTVNIPSPSPFLRRQDSISCSPLTTGREVLTGILQIAQIEGNVDSYIMLASLAANGTKLGLYDIDPDAPLGEIPPGLTRCFVVTTTSARTRPVEIFQVHLQVSSLSQKCEFLTLPSDRLVHVIEAAASRLQADLSEFRCEIAGRVVDTHSPIGQGVRGDYQTRDSSMRPIVYKEVHLELCLATSSSKPSPTQFFEACMKARSKYSGDICPNYDGKLFASFPTVTFLSLERWSSALRNRAQRDEQLSVRRLLLQAEVDVSERFAVLKHPNASFLEGACRTFIDPVFFTAASILRKSKSSFEFSIEKSLGSRSQPGVNGYLDYFIQSSKFEHCFVLEAKRCDTTAFFGSQMQLCLQLLAVRSHRTLKPDLPVCGATTDGLRYWFMVLQSDEFFTSPVFALKGLDVPDITGTSTSVADVVTTVIQLTLQATQLNFE